MGTQTNEFCYRYKLQPLVYSDSSDMTWVKHCQNCGKLRATK